MKQKARAGGGRRKKPQPFAEGSPEGAGQPCRPCVHIIGLSTDRAEQHPALQPNLTDSTDVLHVLPLDMWM